VPLSFVFAGASQGNIMKEHAVLADPGGLSDDHAHAVIDEESSPDLRTRVYLNPGQKPCDLRKQPGEKWYPQLPQKMGEAVNKDGMKSRVEQKLEVSDSRVVSVYGLYILNNGKHLKLRGFSTGSLSSFGRG